MKSSIIAFCLLLLFATSVRGQEIIDLYNGNVPNAKEYVAEEQEPEENPGLIRKVITPTLEVYQADKEVATGAAVIICPGGGYGVLVYNGEGISTAKEFAKLGVTAFVLKYRLPNEELLVDKKIGPLQDALQAIKHVRENATHWGVDPSKVGIMGFSAGGHLASTAATHYEMGVIENKGNTSLRPDFAILVYPVISMQDSLTHLDSRKNLIGPDPTQEWIDKFSNELQVDDKTPPTYLTHAADDKLVDVDNSIAFFEALRHHDVPVEMHIYPKGDHGFVLFQPKDQWIPPMIKWLKTINIVTD